MCFYFYNGRINLNSFTNSDLSCLGTKCNNSNICNNLAIINNNKWATEETNSTIDLEEDKEEAAEAKPGEATARI